MVVNTKCCCVKSNYFPGYFSALDISASNYVQNYQTFHCLEKQERYFVGVDVVCC